LYIRERTGTDAQRSLRIDAAAKRVLLHKEAQLVRLQAAYNKLATTTAEEDLAGLRTQVQNVDTEICLLRRGLLAAVIAVVYSYYRLGWNSTAIANQFGMKSPMVRMWLYGLHTVAMKLAGNKYPQHRWVGGRDNRTASPYMVQEIAPRLFVLRAPGKTLEQ